MSFFHHSPFNEDGILLCDMTDASNYEFIDDVVYKTYSKTTCTIYFWKIIRICCIWFQMQTDQVRKWTGNPMTSD